MPAVERLSPSNFVSRFEKNDVILEEPTCEENQNCPKSPTQPRATSSFSQQIQLLRAQSEGIHEECEDSEVSSTSSAEVKTVEKVPSIRKSKEAEDIEEGEFTTGQLHRTSSMSEHQKPLKSILRQSPFISKENITSSQDILSNQNENSVNSTSNSMKHLKSRFSTNVQHSEDRTEQGNIDAIDKYYEKNNYTVTGIYSKNGKLNNYFNSNNEEDEDDQKQSHNNLPKRSLSMAQSVRSMPIIPINNRFHQSFYWFAHNHKKIGFRHLCMLFLVLIYTLFGAALFYTIESKYEHETLQIHGKKLDNIIFQIAQTLELEILDPEKLTNITQMEHFIKKAYIKLLNAEELYSGSTFFKQEDLENNVKWTYGSAFFFSMNVYTTTGYGSIAPSSSLGKFFVILYGLIFVPLTAVVIRDLGQWALLYLTKMYTIITDNFRRVRGYVDTPDDDEIMSLPIKFSVSVMIIYLISSTVFIFEYDALSGPAGTGITFFHAFYFSFVSISTIGLGDIMPNNVTFSPLITMMFFFGMPILKVVNRVTYICLENGVFGSMTVLENRLDQEWSKATVIPKDLENQTEVPNKNLSTHKTSIASEGLIPTENDGSVPNEYLNNFTIRSIATFMRANGDVYGGGFGRVNMRRGDLRNLTSMDNQATIRSMKQYNSNS